MVVPFVQRVLSLFLAVAFVFFFSVSARAATFEAQVDRTTIYRGESFTLTLTLSGAQQSITPDFGPLRKDFQVRTQGQSSSVNMFNGSFSSAVTWQIVLLPKNTGDIIIPSISVQTGLGVLKTQPLRVTVSAKPSPVASSKDRDVYVTANLSTKNPSLNAPMVYTLRLVASKPVSEITHGDLKIDNAIVELQGDPKVYDTVTGGKNVSVVELRYLITPLKPGIITIPSYVFQGMVSGDRPRRPTQMFDPFSNRAQDPFAVLQDFGVFDALLGQPFTLMTDEVVLNVSGAQANMDPWLPAQGLQISDFLDGEKNAKVGEPFTRRLTLVVNGNTGSVLPSLEDRAAPEAFFSVYAEKPEAGMNITEDGTVTGWREEAYTLVPKYGGDLVLPEIKVPWWDIKNSKVAYASVPARTIKVEGAPAPAAVSQQFQASQSTDLEQNSATSATSSGSVSAFTNISGGFGGILRRQNALVFLTGVAAALIIGVGIYFLVITPRKEEQSQTASSSPTSVLSGVSGVRVKGPEDAVNENARKPAVSLSGLERAVDMNVLKDHFLLFVQQKVGGGPVLSLKDAVREIGQRLDERDRNILFVAVSKLEGALYAGQAESFDDIRNDIVRSLKALKTPASDHHGKVTRLGALNPS
ncbi:MAG: protein BatD [Alphaproteobacteria bacterium]|nr:protein BatD [Alphaproteobacteria bacterium]MCB9974653.1 protein BatD [Rhodospirillales bacterium]